jgi:hypothetical protein
MYDERHWIPAFAGMTVVIERDRNIPTVIPAQGVAGVSCSVLHARGTALACKSVRALQGGIHFHCGSAQLSSPDSSTKLSA